LATSTQNNIQIFDPLTILTANESAAVTVPLEANVLWICSDFVVHFRLKTGENGFRVPANWAFQLCCATLRGKTIFIRNDSGSTATVSIMFENRTSA
jgi:hypothetical protein